MSKRSDMVGEKYDKLTVLGLDSYNKHGQSIWSCLCDCGTAVKVLGNSMRSGSTGSCGCKTISKNKLVFGVGINDADYNVYLTETVNGKLKILWSCPFYVKWYSMLRRCYSNSFHKQQPTYINCTTVAEWHRFSVFKSWMETQDWQDKHLDKDVLVTGNKEYGPGTCLFLEPRVNTFFNECALTKGDWPIGVSFHKQHQKFYASCRCVVTKKSKFLGLFSSPEEAHQAWLDFKREQARLLAAEQTDERVAEALLERYINYGVT